jgi:glucan 1,3-beta-glucosidase
MTSPFSRLCRAETMRTLFLEMAGRGSALPPPDRTRLRFEARLAAVRAEMYGDLCSLEAGPGAEGWDRGPGGVAGAAADAQASEPPRRWRGVNLSSWLLWEPGPADKSWLVASLGPGERPEDEWTLCERLVEKHGQEAAERMVQRYRSERVTRADFAAMKKLGLNAVRVPFGYWALRPRPGEPFFEGCAGFLDDALAWGAEFGLSVVLCLHAAVGFQSQDPPCGRANRAWRPCRFDVDATVDVMRDVALRYGGHPALGGICVLNEPSGDIPPRTMNRYFMEVYSALRVDCRLPASVQIMFPVFHHDFKHFRGMYTEDQGYVNVLFDVHVYQVFGEPYAGWHRMSLAQNLRHADAVSSNHDVRAIADCGERVVVTEFSLALPKWRTNTTTFMEYQALSESERSLLLRCFAQRQLRTFAKHTEGCFFWSWKDDAGPEWSLLECCARGWMPSGPAGDAGAPGSGRAQKAENGLVGESMCVDTGSL